MEEEREKKCGKIHVVLGLFKDYRLLVDERLI
jgi:hypothetical protein